MVKRRGFVEKMPESFGIVHNPVLFTYMGHQIAPGEMYSDVLYLWIIIICISIIYGRLKLAVAEFCIANTFSSLNNETFGIDIKPIIFLVID